jgi:D-alanine transaminase
MILFNNQLVDRSKVSIDIEDRGYQFGDGVYEMFSVYQGNIFRIEDHIKRFEYSAKQIGINLPIELQDLNKKLNQLIQAHQLQNGQIYLQVTRGFAPRNHPFPAHPQPVLTGYVMNKPRPVDQMKNGVSTIILDDIRWLRCDIKSLNLLGSVMAKQQASEKGAFEAILHRNGRVTEGSSSNLFIVKDGDLYTHPLGNLILGGITRLVVLELAESININVIEKALTLEELKQADELFLTSTTSEVMPIISVDGIFVGNGKPGAVTMQLQRAFEEIINLKDKEQ